MREPTSEELPKWQQFIILIIILSILIVVGVIVFWSLPNQIGDELAMNATWKSDGTINDPTGYYDWLPAIVALLIGTILFFMFWIVNWRTS